MKFISSAITAMLLIVFLAGCSTIAVRSQQAQDYEVMTGIYPATRMDALIFLMGWSDSDVWWFVPWGFFEMPISLAFDTVLIPYDLLK